jgi:hypothetical protein
VTVAVHSPDLKLRALVTEYASAGYSVRPIDELSNQRQHTTGSPS